MQSYVNDKFMISPTPIGFEIWTHRMGWVSDFERFGFYWWAPLIVLKGLASEDPDSNPNYYLADKISPPALIINHVNQDNSGTK